MTELQDRLQRLRIAYMNSIRPFEEEREKLVSMFVWPCFYPATGEVKSEWTSANAKDCYDRLGDLIDLKRSEYERNAQEEVRLLGVGL